MAGLECDISGSRPLFPSLTAGHLSMQIWQADSLIQTPTVLSFTPTIDVFHVRDNLRIQEFLLSKES